MEILPSKGTKLKDMTFGQLKTVAKLNQTIEYGIMVGDKIKINDKVSAEIVNIGNDYIEFMTTSSIIDSEGLKEKIKLNNNKEVFKGSMTSFYKYPQTNYEGKDMPVPICFVGSCIQKELEKWVDGQTSDFKAGLKEVHRSYDCANLTYEGKYKQFNRSKADEIERIYLPTIDEVEFIVDNSVTWDNIECFWTASPKNTKTRFNKCSFGYFYTFGRGHISFNYGNKNLDVIALFQIG